MTTPHILDDALAGTLDRWLAHDPDTNTQRELTALRDAGDVAALAQRFSGRLQFGTAGIRGIVGAGPMRMNRLVIQQTSAGLASYLLDAVENAASRGVVVAYDARPDSRQFAEDTAGVFMSYGIKVYLTQDAQPTPIGAYAVMHYEAAAGVVVTASHNPPEYNGYKVYWENGAQIIPPHDARIAQRIDTAAQQPVDTIDLAEGHARALLVSLDQGFINKYQQHVVDAIGKWRAPRTSQIGVAYTALHGVGATLAQTLFDACDLGTFVSVAAQHEPDGTFPTVAFPNPEEPGAMDAVIELARSSGATLACANDPDADRLAVAARDADGEFHMLSGDQIGILLGHYCLNKSDPALQIICASLVSSRMLGRIATSAGATYFETLTGFKWLANTALSHQTHDMRFSFAYEEALGYALGQLVHDKDGLSALVLFCLMTAELASNGKTVFDQLESLYRTHGLFLTHQHSIRTQLTDVSITDRLREAMPRTIAGVPVISTRDLLHGRMFDENGNETALEGYPTDAMIYYLADDARVIVRPSGTEPKTKCYYEVVGALHETDAYDVAFAKTETRLT
ncbi:MAG: phospho-sugar mutase, partial [Pseudomonadota bacterium]